jgi:transposase
LVTITPKDLGGAHHGRSSNQVSSNALTVREGDAGKKQHPVRLDSYKAELVFQKNDFSYIDRIADPNRMKRSGAKGYPPSALFKALVLMYLVSLNSLLELIRFLNSHNDWVVLLDLKRNVEGKPEYKVPDRTAFNHFVKRFGPDRIVEILAVMVCRLMKMGIIKQEKVNLDCKIIWACFKPCTFGNKHDHRCKDRNCKRHKSRDRDASWTWDHHRVQYVFGYKIHILIDSLSGLPVMMVVTKAGFGENRTVPWFVEMIPKLGLHVKEFLADGAYDTVEIRKRIIKKLKAFALITLNPRNCKGKDHDEKMKRVKELRHKWYLKNFFAKWWIDPDSEFYDKEFDKRTLSTTRGRHGRLCMQPASVL